MSYQVIQKDKEGHKYAYEVESYWDPKKKQPRQRRKYLGVWDEETGTIKPKETQRDIVTTKEYGSVYLLKKVSSELELSKKLEYAFGSDGNNILALSMAKILRPSALRNVIHTIEDSWIPEMCNTDSSFKSQWLSNFLVNISKQDIGLYNFCRSIANSKDEALIYDITSLSSYSRNINWLEYGDDYRKLDTPQVNLGLVFSIEKKIPIYYKIFPGSITDVVTITNLISEVKEFGIKNCTYVLDRGFYSEPNVLALIDAEVDFIMPLPFSTTIGKNSISESNLNIENANNARRFGKKIYYVVEKTIDIGGKPLFAFILFNEDRKGDEVSSFYNRLMDIEKELEGKKIRRDPQKVFEIVARDFQNYFSYTYGPDGFHVERRSKAITQAVNRMGKMILLSSADIPWDEALSLYRERDAIEKIFDELKNELDMMPLRVRKNETMKGLTLIYFVSMILRSLLLQRARTAKLLEKDSVEGIILDMSKIRAVRIGNIWKLTEITKKQRIYLEKMSIPIPVSP